MKNRLLALLAVISLLVMGLAMAEPAKFSFGTMQPGSSIRLEPGELGEIKLYFYNLYGNRITHVSMSIAYVRDEQETDIKDRWNITFDPALHEQEVMVSGISTQVVENVFVRPMANVTVAGTSGYDTEETIEYLQASGIKGFIPAKPVVVRIQAPKWAKLGAVYRLRIDSLANWYGETGSMVSAQARSFDYDVLIAKKQYEEQILTKGFALRNIPVIGPVIFYASENPMTVLLVLLVVVMAVYILRMRGSRGREGFGPRRKR